MGYYSMDQVLEGGVFIGDISAAKSVESQSEFGITHVLSICPCEVESEGRKYLKIPIEDDEQANILIHLPMACQFIQNSLDEGGKVLVHCYAGVSRSATVVCAYIMSTQNLSAFAALQLIRKSRKCVFPNHGFMKQLNIFENCLYQPSFANELYRTWNINRKRRPFFRHPFQYICLLIPIIPDKLFVSDEHTEARVTMMTSAKITHVLSIAPCALEYQSLSIVEHKGMDITDHDFSWHDGSNLLFAFLEACQFIHSRIESGGQVLIHSDVSFRLKTFLCAYLIFSQGSPPREADSVTEGDDAEIFTPESLRMLEFFDGCVDAGSAYHPIISEWAEQQAKGSDDP